jgi:hypothetical protein
LEFVMVPSASKWFRRSDLADHPTMLDDAES